MTIREFNEIYYMDEIFHFCSSDICYGIFKEDPVEYNNSYLNYYFSFIYSEKEEFREKKKLRDNLSFKIKDLEKSECCLIDEKELQNLHNIVNEIEMEIAESFEEHINNLQIIDFIDNYFSLNTYINKTDFFIKSSKEYRFKNYISVITCLFENDEISFDSFLERINLLKPNFI
jgi:hypothetical protein